MTDMQTIEATWNQYESEIKAVRTAVFVHEQGYSLEAEFDAQDPDYHHVLVNLKGQWVGTGRLLPDGHLGRIAVLAAYRKHGIGRTIVEKLEDMAQKLNMTEVCLSSQDSAIGFYEKLGYRAEGDRYMDGHIEHQLMRKNLPILANSAVTRVMGRSQNLLIKI